MAPPGTESQTFRNLREEDLDEVVKYDIDIDIMGLNVPPLRVKTTLVVHLVRSLNVVPRIC